MSTFSQSCVVTNVNEVYVKVDCEPSLQRDLDSFFQFEVPGARFMPAVRNRLWNGIIHLYSIETGQIYKGLLPYIKEFARRNEVDIIIEEGVETDREIDKTIVKDFIESLKPKSKGKLLEVRDYQIDAVHNAISNNRALLLSPTASGKSLIIYSLVRYYQMMNLKSLIIVPTTSLVEQMYSDFLDYGWKENYLQKLYQGHDKKVISDVMISTWQSLYKMPKKYFDEFGCVIGDEAHLYKAKSLINILTKLTNAKYRFGLTGTLDDSQTHKLVLEGLFGSLNKVIKTKELMDSKTLAELDIKCLLLQYSDEECKSIKEFKYAQEIDFLVTSKKRNEFISNLTVSTKGNTLCLFQLVEKHGAVLHELIKEKVSPNRKVFFVFGGTNADTREDIRRITEKEKNAIIVASYGTFSTGINIRNLHNVIFASPSKSRIRVLQSIGRGLRKGDNKKNVKLYDIADDLTYKSRKNFTLKHFIERINLYNEEQFEYDIKKIQMG